MRTLFIFLLLLGLLIPIAGADTTITYQGQLQDSDGPVNQNTGMEFRLFDSAQNGSQVGDEVIFSAVPIDDGLFQVDLDFGDIFDGSPLYLEVMVAGQTLQPRQRIATAPMAQYAMTPAGPAGPQGPEGASPFVLDGDAIEYWANDQGMALYPDPNSDEGPQVVIGHSANQTNDIGATISGGGSADEPNVASGEYAIIAGGQNNEASNTGAVVSGGRNNSANGFRSNIAGGSSNTVTGQSGNIGGGAANEVTGHSSVVAGGSSNTAEGNRTTIGGGSANLTDNIYSTVAGGSANHATGASSTVPGGEGNRAFGDYSFAAGHDAIAEHDGAFVWADDDGWFTTPEFKSEADHEFAVRAQGGVRLVTDVDTSGVNQAGAVLASGGSSWGTVSDRNAKMNIDPADPQHILNRLTELPISEYSYRSQDQSIRHMGPMAQDFYPLFGLGEDELRINAMNLAGISLAAIQALHDRLEVANHRIDQLEAKNRSLQKQIVGLQLNRQEVEEMANRLARLEALLLEQRRLAGE